MSGANGPLERLREEIDRVDDSIHDLLMRRAEIVEQIRLAKTDGKGSFRPAREAQILRRLVKRHRGAFPAPVLACLWRQMIDGMTLIQGPFAIAVLEGENGAWDLARDHFGLHTPVRAFASAGQVVHAVREGDAHVGVLSMPPAEDSTGWWSMLGGEIGAPRVCARLPFGMRGNARGEAAFAVARLTPEPTGDDHTLIVLQLREPMSRDAIAACVTRIGLKARLLAWHRDRQGEAMSHLLEVEDFLGPSDPRLNEIRFRGEGRIAGVSEIGAFAVPLGEAS